jgi:hypothetical protein
MLLFGVNMMGLGTWEWVKRFSILLIGLVLIGYGAAIAGSPEPVSKTNTGSLAADSGSKTLTFSKDRDVEFYLTSGLRKDSLDWSIAGTSAGTNPNVLSELDWSNVDSYQVTLANRSRFLRHIHCRTTFSYAGIQDGTLRDSDYDGDHKTMERSRSISESKGYEMWDFSTAGGYAFVLYHDRLLVAPMLGVSYHKQNLRITNGFQVVSDGSTAPAVGPLSSQLDSGYFARWMGPWIGVDLRYLTEKRGPDYLTMAFGLSVEFHHTDYYGEGNWNLRSDLAHPKSFEHEADGYGICISGEWLITLAAHWDLAFNVNYQHWSTSSGTDRKFLASGESSVARLNEVNWTSSSFMVGANFHF